MLWKQILRSFNSHCSFLKLSCFQNNLKVLVTTSQGPHTGERGTDNPGTKRSSDVNKKLKPRAWKRRLPAAENLSCMQSSSGRVHLHLVPLTRCTRAALQMLFSQVSIYSSIKSGSPTPLPWPVSLHMTQLPPAPMTPSHTTLPGPAAPDPSGQAQP